MENYLRMPRPMANKEMKMIKTIRKGLVIVGAMGLGLVGLTINTSKAQADCPQECVGSEAWVYQCGAPACGTGSETWCIKCFS